MKYVLNPDRAQKMLDRCKAGNNIYEVTHRHVSEAVWVEYIEARTAAEAEDNFLAQASIVSAVARQVKQKLYYNW